MGVSDICPTVLLAFHRVIKFTIRFWRFKKNTQENTHNKDNNDKRILCGKCCNRNMYSLDCREKLTEKVGR